MIDKEENKEENKEGNKEENKEENKDEIVVVTVRCIDMAAPCSNIDIIRCSECGEMTWLSISWKGKHIDRAVCEPCFEKRKCINRDYTVCVTRSCLNDALKQLKGSSNIEGTDADVKKRMMKHMEKKMGMKIVITD